MHDTLFFFSSTLSAGAKPFGTGHMGGALVATVGGQVNLAHSPSSVSNCKIILWFYYSVLGIFNYVFDGHKPLNNGIILGML